MPTVRPILKFSNPRRSHTSMTTTRTLLRLCLFLGLALSASAQPVSFGPDMSNPVDVARTYLENMFDGDIGSALALCDEEHMDRKLARMEPAARQRFHSFMAQAVRQQIEQHGGIRKIEYVERQRVDEQTLDVLFVIHTGDGTRAEQPVRLVQNSTGYGVIL